MQNIYLSATILSLIAGSSIFLGALLASKEHIRRHWLKEEIHHGVTAFGGGALLAAIALVLIPEGLKAQPLWTSILSFVAGGFSAMWLDSYFSKRKTTTSQFIAMMLDFIPETIVIGAIITKSFSEAVLLSLIIFTQNFPESFSAYREIKQSSMLKPKQLLLGFLIISVSGPVYIFLGANVLASHDLWLGILMTYCAGAILYLMFNDIAPQAHLKNRFLPPMGAQLGFLIGMIGYQLTR